MAVAMTYDYLVNQIIMYLERTDEATVQMIPSFIMYAEQIIASELKFLGNLNVSTSQMVAGNPIIQKPARWHKTVSMNVTVNGKRQPIFLRKYEYLKEYWPDSTQTDIPLYYADYDYEHWIVAPTPNLNYNFEVLFYQRVQPLDETNQTNWFTVYAPQALLYGSLLQAMPFLKNDDRIPMWRAEYDKIMQTLKNEDIQRTGDRQTTVLDT